MKASHPAANILMGEPAENGLSAWTFGDEPEMFITDIMYCHWTKRNKDKRC